MRKLEGLTRMFMGAVRPGDSTFRLIVVAIMRVTLCGIGPLSITQMHEIK